MVIAYKEGGVLVSIHVDATIREEHGLTSLVTEHPVETGANVSDHVRPELDRITMDVVVSNTPITLPGSHMDGVTAEVKPLPIGSFDIFRRSGPARLSDPGAPPTRIILGAQIPGREARWTPAPMETSTTDSFSPNTLQFSAEFNRVRAIFDEFRHVINHAILCTIYTELRWYKNMIVHSMSAPRDVSSANALTFTLEAKQIKFVSSEIVAVEPVEVRAKKKKNKGPQPATPIPKPDEPAATATGSDKSDAKILFDKVYNLVAKLGSQ